MRILVEANKVLKKLQMTKSGLVFPGLGDPAMLEVIVYQDAAYANLPSGASQGGYIIFISGTGHVAPISWSSKKLGRVTKSPLASEASILADAAGFLIAMMLQEIFGLKDIPSVTCNTDNKSLYDHLHTAKVTQDPRMRVDIARLKRHGESWRN